MALILSACADRLFFGPVDGFAYHEPDARYEAHFPYYVELCAVSQFRSPELGSGGSPGHAAMYLKGACRDTDAPFPKLRRCRGSATDPDDPEHGAGVSVNRWFRNVNWIAVSGRGTFYDGGLAPGEAVTRESFQAVAQAAIDAGVFRGVELWPWRGQTPDSDLLDFVERQSAGTDFALRLARSALCGRMPVQAEMMDEIVHFLNDLNREYATGATDFQWSGYHDNCVHTLRNALAAASIGDPISVRATRLRQLFHLAIPANEAIQLAALGTLGPLEYYRRIFREDSMRNALLEFGWLPTRHGALLVSLPVRAENELFDTQPRLLVFQGPATMRTTRRLLEMLDHPRFTELDANLAHFEQTYRALLAAGEERDVLSGLSGDRYRRVRRRYDEVIAAVPVRHHLLPVLRGHPVSDLLARDVAGDGVPAPGRRAGPRGRRPVAGADAGGAPRRLHPGAAADQGAGLPGRDVAEAPDVPGADARLDLAAAPGVLGGGRMRYVNLALIVLLTAAVLLFKFQNLSTVTVSLLNMSVTLPASLLVIIVYVLGMWTGGAALSLVRGRIRGALPPKPR
jgi:uncharacterized integral membrane protein